MPVILILLVAACYYLVPHLHMRSLRRRVQRVCREHRLIALTFDDGPGRLLTPLVLERLANAQVKASFFVLGRSALDSPDLVKAILDAGHSIGSHGQQHLHHWRSNPLRAIADSKAGLRALRAILGRPRAEVAFRPPYDRLNLLSWLHLVIGRVPIGSWTHDTFDSWPNDDVPPRMVLDLLRQSRGGVVLLHDHDRSTHGAAGEMLSHLDAILELRNEGYRFVNYEELASRLHDRGRHAREPDTRPASTRHPEPVPAQRRPARNRRSRNTRHSRT